MKAFLNLTCLLLVAVHLNAAEWSSRKSAVLVLSPEMETAEGRVAVEKLKSDLAAQGVSVIEISVDEAQDLGQAGLIADGGPVITAESRLEKLNLRCMTGYQARI